MIYSPIIDRIWHWFIHLAPIILNEMNISFSFAWDFSGYQMNIDSWEAPQNKSSRSRSSGMKASSLLARTIPHLVFTGSFVLFSVIRSFISEFQGFAMYAPKAEHLAIFISWGADSHSFHYLKESSMEGQWLTPRTIEKKLSNRVYNDSPRNKIAIRTCYLCHETQ